MWPLISFYTTLARNGKLHREIFHTAQDLQRLGWCRIVIPWFVHLYKEIIHQLKLVDYLLVKADKLWYNCYLTAHKLSILKIDDFLHCSVEQAMEEKLTIICSEISLSLC